MASDDVEFDQSGAKYFCEMAQSIDPHNTAIFNLKHRLMTSQNNDPKEVADFLLKELETRPTDIKLRVRLLKHLVQNNSVKEAYKHASDIEAKDLPIFHNSVVWYETVAEVLMKYQRSIALPSNLGWEFWFLSVGVWDKLVSLTMDERFNNIKTTTESVSTLFNFDQTLASAVKCITDCPDKQLVQEFLHHYRAQLCLHLSTLVFKQAQKDLFKYKEASNIVLPLLFFAYNSPMPDLQSMWFAHAPEDRRNLAKRWRKEAAFRCSQVGHVLTAAAKDRKAIVMDKAAQFSAGMWRDSLFKKVFVTRDQQLKMKSSYFITEQQFVEIVIRLPQENDLIQYDEEAQLLHPDCLHHHIWIALNNNLSDHKLTVFDGLPYSVKHLRNCGAETLNVLDLQSFVYCATICARQNLDSSKQLTYYHVDKPSVLPAAVTQELGTINQDQFFRAAYKVYRNEYEPGTDQLRLTLIEGIKILRCVDNALNVNLLVILANAFQERAKRLTKQSEVEFNEARAELYWKSALPVLEKLKIGQAVSYPPNKLFNYKDKEMALNEICGHLEAGKLFLASLLMKKKEYEKSLRLLEGLKDPYASFQQAQIYKQMADQQTNQSKENVTSEMRSQNIILLSRARDCLYLTLDRLREPSVDPKHPLNTQLGTEIEIIERLLSRIDPDCTNRNECDGMSDENVSSADSAGDHYVTGYASNLSYLNGNTFRGDQNNHSTPYRSDYQRREAKPSPERLDAQLRQLTASKDASISHLLEHKRLMVESHRSLIEELKYLREAVTHLTTTMDDLKGVKQGYEEIKDIKKSMTEIKSSIEELDTFKNFTDMVLEMKKEIADLKKDVNKSGHLTDEDIYGLTNDYSTDYNLASNLTPSNLYPNYQSRMPPTGSLYGPPPLYPGMYHPMAYAYGGLGLPQAPAALPFGSAEQLATDFRNITAALSQVPTPVAAASSYPNTALPSTSLGVGLLTGAGLAQNLSQASALPPQGQSTLFKDLGTPKSTGAVISTNTPFSVTRTPPVNVVITTSDPLPSSTTTTTSQPVLSVTIPAQHLKGNRPHNYQIPLPVFTSSEPSILSQPPPPITTQSLLSNVAPPVYSAVSGNNNQNVSLGLQIEKSLEQSFGNQTSGNISAGSIEEHDPCPDFKPIVPLPDEVPVTTGEENETVLFCQRAKLYRYDASTKEWKERGVGSLKILFNPDTKKIRILMRRDQVHKICANHFLTTDMTLTPMPKSDRAYIWAAHDFADGEMVVEKLCVRFKTSDEATKFSEAFEKAKASLERSTSESISQPSSAIEQKTVADSTNKSNVSLGGFVFANTPNFTPNQETAVTPKVTQPETPKLSPFSGFSFGAKSTPNVTPKLDFGKSTKEVGKTTSDDESHTDDFVPTAEFKPVIPLPELVEVKTGEENSEVIFESRAKLLRFDTNGEVKEWKDRGVGIIKLLKDNTVRVLMRREQVHKVCCNHQVLKNMEFKVMASNPKALTWCAKDFSEGVIKSETFAARFKTEELAKGFLKAVTTAQENMDENNCVVNKHVDKHMKADTPSKSVGGFGDKFKPAKGSWECKNCYVTNEGKANYCLACETPKNDAVPKKDDASGSAFSFGVATPGLWGGAFQPKAGSWECKSCYIRNDADQKKCVSCETPKEGESPVKDTSNKGVNLDTGGLKFSFGIPTTNQTPPQQKPTSNWGDAFKPKEGSWECKECYTRNNPDVLYCVSCDNPKDETVPKKQQTKAVNLDIGDQEFTFGMPTSSTTSASRATFTFGQSSVLPSSGFSFGGRQNESEVNKSEASSFAFKPAVSKVSEVSSPSEQFVFGSPQKHDFDFTPRSPRRISSGQKDDESDCSYVEEEGDNIYFKPVIPLPDKVDVKTGEEEEDVLYCHRAKLYRFVGGEWKERGLGDIKILKKKDNGKCRVVMRREQVFKICLNHVLTAQIKYVQKDEKSWLFCAPDYSEGTICNEQFCIRFKSAEIAEEFKKAIDDAVSNSGASSSDTVVESDSTDDVIFVSETKVTADEEKEAIKLGLPPKFMSYRQLPDCQCAQCKKDDEYLKELFDGKPKVQTLFKNTTFGTPLSAPLSTSSSGSSAFGTPKENVFSFKSVADSETSALKNLLAKPSVLGVKSPSFSTSNLDSTTASNTLFTTASKSGGSLFNTPTDLSKSQSGTFFFNSGNTPSSASGNLKTNIFGNASNTTTSVFGGTPNVTSTDATNTSTPVSTTPGIFGTPPNLFGGTNTKTTGSIFGGAASDTAAPKTSIFGGSAQFKTTGNLFATPSTPSEPGKGSIFGSSPGGGTGIFGGATNKTDLSSTQPSIFGGTAPTFGSVTKPHESKPIFGGDTPKSGTTSKLAEGDAAILDSTTGLTFASLAAKVDSGAPPAFSGGTGGSDKSTTPFAFLGAGKPVFASAVDKHDKNKSTGGEDGEEGTANDEEYDPHYDPIVPLPDAIVVSTGEEDETVLFNERAKLFRFDVDNKEWKERGVGQMKVLHHPQNSKSVFLMWNVI